MQLSRTLLYCCISLILFLGGCSETVSPIVGEEPPFTIYRYLDPTTDAQIVRIIPIAETIDEVDRLDVDATVRTIHMDSGEAIVWQKTSVSYPDSTQGVVFRANFRPEHNSAYRLEVSNTEGELITAETVVPELIEIAPIDEGNPFMPGFFVQGSDPNLIRIAMNYSAIAMQPGFSGLPDVVIPVSVSYKGTEEPANDGLEIRASLLADRDLILAAMGKVCITSPFITVRTAELEFFIGDDEWVPPGGDFDATTLVQPGVFSNIENGYGYFGSGYSVVFSIRLTSNLLQQIGYGVERPCFPGLGFDPTIPECQELMPCFEEGVSGF